MRFSGMIGYTTTRLVLMIFLAQLLATGGILFYVHKASEGALIGEQKAFVGELHDNLLVQYRSGGLSGLAYEIEKRLELGRNRDMVILLTLPNGQNVVGNIDRWPTQLTGNSNWMIQQLYRKGSDTAEPVGFTATLLPDGSRLLTGHVLTSEQRLSEINRTAITTAFVLALPIALLIAFLLGRLISRRIELITKVTDAVRGGDLSQRIYLDGTDGPFDRLSDGINAMLDQLEALVSELRVMTDGLAHDLRSPITRLKSVIEHAIVETRDETALAALQKVSTEAETLLAMLTTALQISRAEAGIGRDRFVETDISELMSDLVEVYGPLAEDHEVDLQWVVPAGLAMSLHRELVSQALGNLIENALKYAEGADLIRLTGTRQGDRIIISVADNGVGIPAGRRAEAQKRFGRLDSARTHIGSGLGLSLVEAVARLHGGKVELKDNEPGLRVDLTFVA